MNHPANAPRTGADADEAEYRRTARLREEIDFWRGMLESADGRTPPAVMERMNFALALAEYRLRAVDGGGRDRMVS